MAKVMWIFIYCISLFGVLSNAWVHHIPQMFIELGILLSATIGIVVNFSEAGDKDV